MRAIAALVAAAALSIHGAVPAAAQGAPATLRQACNADFKKLCANVTPGGGRIIACMKAKESELSQDCRAALQAEGQKRTAGK